MASLANRQNNIDQWVALNWDAIVAMLPAQWQGAWTHDAPVDDGPGRSPDLTRRGRPGLPSYFEIGLASFFPGNGGGKIDFGVSIDEYRGPLGSGFAARVQLLHQGVIYERWWATGPQAGDWPTTWHIAVPTVDPPGA